MPYTLDAAKQGWISIDHARLMGESHQRAPLSEAQELELITVAISEDLDQFKKTMARSEGQRRADDGLTRHDRQRARRGAKVFDGDEDMVILYAELDRIAGERAKTALHSLSHPPRRRHPLRPPRRTADHQPRAAYPKTPRARSTPNAIQPPPPNSQPATNTEEQPKPTTPPDAGP